MKKRIIICSLLVIVMMLMASTAFAYSVSFSSTPEKSAGSYYISLNMYGKDVCSSSTINGAGCFHKVLLRQSGTRTSAILTVENGGPGGKVNLYPYVGGTHNFMIYNYYYFGEGTLRVTGTFSNLYK